MDGYLIRRTSLVPQMVKHLLTMWETQVWSLGWKDPLEKEMATLSSTLAWKIPWTEERCGLQSTGSQKSDTTERLHSFHGVRKCSNLILLHVTVQFSQHHLLKRLFLPQCIFLPPLSKIRSHRCMGLILGFLSCSIGLHFCFYASTILSWWL